MEKFLKLGLALSVGLVLVFLSLFIMTSNAKNVVTQERDELQKINSKLEGKVGQLENGLRESESKISLLNGELERVSLERQDLQAKYEMVNRAREELVAKVNELREKRAAAKSEPTQTSASLTAEGMPQASDAYWAGILQAKTDLEMQLATVRTELKSLQIANEGLQREKNNLELEIKNITHDKNEAKRQMEYNQKVMDRISQELVTERNDKIKITDTFKVIKSENAVLTRQVESLSTRKVELEKKLQELRESKTVVEKKFDEMAVMLTGNIQQVNELKDQLESVKTGRPLPPPLMKQNKDSSVQLPAIVVRPQVGKVSGNSYLGKVVGLSKENNFVIVDLGQESGARVGDLLQVYSNGERTGELEVIRVSKNVSACDIKKETNPIKIGDLVK